jgi:tetratricopeptide (TPR) repeat protein
LANALLSKGDLDGAILRYTACLALSPNQAEAQYNVASALLRKGRTDEAIAHYRKTLELRPENADAHANLGSAFLAKDRIRDAIAQYRDALALTPKNVAAQSNLAWLLATSPDQSLRNGQEAVLLAEQASQHFGANRPVILRILRPPMPKLSRFAQAAAMLNRRCNLPTAKTTHFNRRPRKEIALYQSGFPYHKEQ